MAEKVNENNKTAKHALRTNQVQILLFSALIADAILVYFNTGVWFTAHEKVVAAIINAAIVIIFAYIFLNKTKFLHKSVIFSVTAFFALCFNGAGTLYDGEKFMRFANEAQYSSLLTVALILAICIYALKCAEHTLQAICTVLIAIFLFLAAILLIANWQNIKLTNLSHAWQATNGALVCAFMTFRFPAALLLFTVAPSNEIITVKRNIMPAILAFCSLQIILAIFSELVFAGSIKEYSQPIYALAITAQISVFKHFEPIYFFIFMFAIIIKTIVLLLGALFAIKPLLKDKTKTMQISIVICTLAILLIIISYISIYITSLFASVLCVFALIAYKLKFNENKGKPYENNN